MWPVTQSKIIQSVGKHSNTRFRQTFSDAKETDLSQTKTQIIQLRVIILPRSLFPMAQQPLVSQGLLIIEASRTTHHTLYDSPGRVIGPMQGTLTAPETDIHAPGRIRTRNTSKRAAADPRLRPLGHWDRYQQRFTFMPALTFRLFSHKVHKTESANTGFFALSSLYI